MSVKWTVQLVFALSIVGLLAACSSNPTFRINSDSFDTHLSCRGAEYTGGRCTDR